MHKAKNRSNSISANNSKDGGPDALGVDDHVDDAMCKVKNGEEDENDQDVSEKNADTSVMFAPKCLVLLSRVKDFRVLKVRTNQFILLFSLKKSHLLQMLMSRY